MPIVSEQTEISLATESAHAHILEVAGMYHDAEFRMTQLTYLKEALGEEIRKAEIAIFQSRPNAKSFKVNGALFMVQQDPSSWTYKHSAEYRELNEQLFALQKKMRASFGKGPEEGQAKFRPERKRLDVFLIGNAKGDLPKERYVKE